MRALEVREHLIEGGAGAVIMNKVVGEFRELVENDIILVALELGALVIYLLDVAFRSRRADDVGGIRYPFLEPLETFPAHARRQHSHAAASENARYRYAASAVIAGGWPDGTVARRVERSRHQSGNEAGIGGEHLVRADHRETPPQQDDDRRLHAGERLRQDHVAGQSCSVPAFGVVEQMHPPQVFPVWLIRADGRELAVYGIRDERRAGELCRCRQRPW